MEGGSGQDIPTFSYTQKGYQRRLWSIVWSPYEETHLGPVAVLGPIVIIVLTTTGTDLVPIAP